LLQHAGVGHGTLATQRAQQHMGWWFTTALLMCCWHD
jgi:hypothetical protein